MTKLICIKKIISVLIFLFGVFIVGGCSSILSTGNSTQEAGTVTIEDGRKVKAALNIALQAVKNDDVNAADQAFKHMMTLSPRSPTSLNHYAIFLREQWRIEEAENIYLTALDYSPRDAMTHWNLGVLYDLYLGKFKLAIKHYELYATNTAQPDKRVKGWIMDLQRRIKNNESTLAKGGAE